MKGKLESEGSYELFQTTKGHQILSLNNKNYFAVIKGQKGEMLIGTDSDHEKEKTLKHGKFYLASFDNDPEFNDIPHLFLQEGNKFREWILPNDKPTEKDYQKKLVRTGNMVSMSKVEEHIKGSANKGSEKKASGSPSRKSSSGRSRDNLDNKSKNELMEMAKKKNIRGRSAMNKKQLIEELK
jgi:hypothetical protein